MKTEILAGTDIGLAVAVLLMPLFLPPDALPGFALAAGAGFCVSAVRWALLWRIAEEGDTTLPPYMATACLILAACQFILA